MARKIIFSVFLLFTILLFNNKFSYCATLPTLELEQCEGIFDFAKNTSKLSNKTYYNSSDPLTLMNYFNNNISETLFYNTNQECDSSYHLIVYCRDNDIYFLTTNATMSNVLDFIVIDNVNNNALYRIKSQYAIKLTFTDVNSYTYNFISNFVAYTPIFYVNGNQTMTPKIDGETLLTPNLYYLGAKPYSDVSFSTYGGTANWYFLEHYYGFRTDDPQNPNNSSGDTPSGDTPSGDLPNYNNKLDNISGLITNTNSKLDGISGEIGQTNNKLDGISGELGEINDNLTTVPDLSGTTINSGDIESALNFDFVEDPYSNFWLELTTGLSFALTSNNRSITIDFRNETYNINLDDFALQVPDFLKSFLAIISTTLVVWQIVKYIKVIIDKISTGDMDYVLAMNEEERNS